MNLFAARRIHVALFLLLAMISIIAAVLAFQHLGGYIPCKLCLQQRQPYYLAIPLALLASVSEARGWSSLSRLLLAAIAIAMLATFAMAVYHAGVEWAWWAGPDDCGATDGNISRDVESLLDDLTRTRPPACDEAAGRFIGLSFAGWNAIASAALAAIAIAFAVRSD